MNDEELDRMLQQMPDPEPSPQLLRAVAEIPLRHPQHGGSTWSLRWLWRATASAVAVTALGVALGMLTAEPLGPNSEDDEWASMAALTFGPMDEELAE
jgi:hypothetical protein